MNNLQREVGRAMLRQLSGFRGYPKAIRLPDGNFDSQGEGRFVDCLCEISLSVEHALAVIESFDGEFPTIREMRDVALNLRPRFERKADERKEWEAKYGKPDPAFADSILSVAKADPVARRYHHEEELRAMLWQAIRDSIYYTENPDGRRELVQIDDDDERINAFKFWRIAAKRNGRNHPSEFAAFRAELAERGWDALMEYDWARGKFPPAAQRRTLPALAVPGAITQSDINRELRAQGRMREPGEDD